MAFKAGHCIIEKENGKEMAAVLNQISKMR
jgi:hypothetical protein